MFCLFIKNTSQQNIYAFTLLGHSAKLTALKQLLTDLGITGRFLEPTETWFLSTHLSYAALIFSSKSLLIDCMGTRLVFSPHLSCVLQLI